MEDHPEGHKDVLPVRPKQNQGDNSESDSEYSAGEEEVREHDDWQILAGMGPEMDTDGWMGPAFGDRALDIDEDWHMAGRE